MLYTDTTKCSINNQVLKACTIQKLREKPPIIIKNIPHDSWKIVDPERPTFQLQISNVLNTYDIRNTPLSRENGNAHAAPWCIRVGGGGGGRATPMTARRNRLWTICLLLLSSVASFLVLGGGGGKTPKCTDKIYMYLYCASERSERAPQKHIFSGIKIHLHTYTINAVSFNYLWYGAI